MKNLKVVAFVMLVLMLASGSASDVWAQFSIKVATDQSGRQLAVSAPEGLLADSLASSGTGVETGYSLGLEYVPLDIEGLFLGVGAEFQLPRGLENAEGKMRHHAAYVIGRGTFPGRITMYAVGRFGVSLFQPDEAFKAGDNDLNYEMNTTLSFRSLRDNIHYGIGGGLFMGENFFVEAMYVRQKTRVEAQLLSGADAQRPPFEYDMAYTRWSFAIGYFIR